MKQSNENRFEATGPEILKFERADEYLVACVPELKTSYLNELEAWDGESPGAMVMYSQLLNPLLDRLLESDDPSDLPMLKRIFDFIERLASARDSRFHDLVRDTICAHLDEDVAAIRRARLLMGPVTRRLLRALQRG